MSAVKQTLPVQYTHRKRKISAYTDTGKMLAKQSFIELIAQKQVCISDSHHPKEGWESKPDHPPSTVELVCAESIFQNGGFCLGSSYSQMTACHFGPRGCTLYDTHCTRTPEARASCSSGWTSSSSSTVSHSVFPVLRGSSPMP